MNVNGKWMYNRADQEFWCCDYYNSRNEAIKAGRKEYPDTDFYVGQCEQIEVTAMYDAEKIIELIGEALDDQYNSELEFGQNFYNEAIEYCNELDAQLEKVVNKWLKKHKFCEDCFVIRDPELICSCDDTELAKMIGERILYSCDKCPCYKRCKRELSPYQCQEKIKEWLESEVKP